MNNLINEDIKILERMIKNLRFEANHLIDEGMKEQAKTEYEAIEHLIEAYRKIKEENELMQAEFYRLEDIEDDRDCNYIPNSKIKEKIKELERIKYTALTDRTVEMMNDKINILQLILKESEE